jgi:hypothetical protein
VTANFGCLVQPRDFISPSDGWGSLAMPRSMLSFIEPPVAAPRCLTTLQPGKVVGCSAKGAAAGRSSPPDAKTKEPTSWQTLTASVAPLLTPLSNLSDLPVKWGISKQDVDIGEQDLHTKSKDGRFSFQLENSRFFGLLLTSVISSILVVAEQQI